MFYYFIAILIIYTLIYCQFLAIILLLQIPESFSTFHRKKMTFYQMRRTWDKIQKLKWICYLERVQWISCNTVFHQGLNTQKTSCISVLKVFQYQFNSLLYTTASSSRFILRCFQCSDSSIVTA